ncbi:MAG: hypothetical protein RBS80_24810 [Thermoguttaceae bacterium]|jgi:hypothetical protein|nr:hypothetical protein [Thermoguttaceae bacterium]
MTNVATASWATKRTDETRHVEQVLRDAGFDRVDAYRYNSASIRVRVIDTRFEGLPTEKRDAMVEPHIEKLPARTQADIVTLVTFAPSDLEKRPETLGQHLLNAEFETPSPSRL